MEGSREGLRERRTFGSGVDSADEDEDEDATPGATSFGRPARFFFFSSTVGVDSLSTSISLSLASETILFISRFSHPKEKLEHQPSVLDLFFFCLFGFAPLFLGAIVILTT